MEQLLIAKFLGSIALPLLYTSDDLGLHYWARSVCTIVAATVGLASLYWPKVRVNCDPDWSYY